MKPLSLLFCCAVAALTSSLHAGEDLLIADFEGTNYGEWKTTGQAFGAGPAHGTLPGQMSVEGFLGKGLVDSYLSGDDSVGTLTSPAFKIQRNYIRFLIGGGGFAGKTCINLVIEGKTVRTATGPNTQPGGSEKLDWQEWDLREFAGREASIEIVDQAKGGWGHINVDHIVQTDQRMPVVIKDASREITVEKRYLNLPIKNGAPKKVMRFIVDGQAAREFEIELADGQPDWWAYMNLEEFKGKTARIQVDKLREDSAGLKSLEQSDEIKDTENLYQEKLRPQFHFTARRGWNNDPNGLVFYKGEYHLFFQYNPYGWDWGNMHWGHAVSQDLVHWKELPIALYPDALGTMFSGSAVVDWNNTSGFQTGKENVLVCFYTAAGNPFTQCIAYSNDKGRTWTKYAKNPVLPHVAGGNRDPKVIWYEPKKMWVMALYIDKSDYALFSSPDLKKWDRLCDVTVPNASECPDFFEIALDGKQSSKKWVFYAANGLYLVGQFDGKVFRPEFGPNPLNLGNCFYASQTYSDIPKKDGRRILLPWGQVATPGMPFNQMIGLPIELTLRTTESGPRLFAKPVKELECLRKGQFSIKDRAVAPDTNPLSELKGELVDIDVALQLGDATEISLVLRGIPVNYNTKTHELSCRDKKATLEPQDGKIRIRALVDRTSIDIFGNDGRVYMPMGVIVPQENQSFEMKVTGGNARITALQAYELQSAWK